MSINTCYNAKNWKRARNDIDKIQVVTKAADNMQKVVLNGPNCGCNCKLLAVHLLTLAGYLCPPREELKSIKRHK